MKRGKSQKKNTNLSSWQIKPPTFIIVSITWKLWNTWDQRWGVAHNIENMGVQSDTFKSMGFNLSQG